MKKQLLSIFAGVAAGTIMAQPNPAPEWSIFQNAAFTNTTVGIKFMDAVDANVMWVTGYDGTQPGLNYNWFSRTINGGTSFNSGVIFANPSNPTIGDTSTFVLSNLSAIDANTAWVCAFRRGPAPYTYANQGGGALYRTVDGGTTWNNMTAPGMYTNTTASFANFVAFLTPSIGICNGDPVGGEFELWRTVNGGLSWSIIPGGSIPNPSANEYAIVDLYAKQGNSNLWFGTNQGRMYRTTDAGISWNVSTVAPNTTTITEIAFSTPLLGVVYGVDASLNFVMYNTTDGGVNWSQIMTIDPNVGRNDIVGVPGSSYFVSGGAGTGNQVVSYSSDNGVTWTSWPGTNVQYLTLDFVDASTGWAGSFSSQSDPTDPTIEGIFKYNGPALQGTVTPTSIFTIPSYICGPNGVVTPSNTSTGSAPLSYSWTSSPAAVISNSNATAPTITFSGNNSYTITLTVNGSLGTHVSTQVIDVITCTAPVPSFTIASSVCNNVNVIAANSSVITPAASYSWSTSPSVGVTYPSGTVAYNPTIKFANPGTYTVTVLASNVSGTATATQTIVIDDCRPVANFTIAEEGFCAGVKTVGTSTILSSVTFTPTWINTAPSHTLTWNIFPNSGVTQLNYGPYAKLWEIDQPGVYSASLTVTNSSGASLPVVKTFTVYDCAAVGLAENNSLNNNLSIFPNPAHDVLNVSLSSFNSDVYKLKLINVLGAVVYEETITKGNTSINLSGKAKGIYFLTVESNNQKATKKVVVE